MIADLASSSLADRVSALERSVVSLRRRLAIALGAAAALAIALVVACGKDAPTSLTFGGVTLDERGLEIKGYDGGDVTLVNSRGLQAKSQTSSAVVTAESISTHTNLFSVSMASNLRAQIFVQYNNNKTEDGEVISIGADQVGSEVSLISGREASAHLDVGKTTALRMHSPDGKAELVPARTELTPTGN